MAKQAQNLPREFEVHGNIVNALPYPAGIYYGESWTLLHNDAWASCGRDEGHEPRGWASLSSSAQSLFNRVMEGTIPGQIEAYELLQHSWSGSLTAILTPLSIPGHDEIRAVLAQLLPRPFHVKDQEIPSSSNQPSDFDPARASSAEEKKHVQLMAVDEHPLFCHFAENLPTGVAILDHTAEAFLVNKSFWELTTHQYSDKSFAGWPQSIHEVDYDRVMQAYQAALEAKEHLRTEYRAIGQCPKYRLLLLAPLDPKKLYHERLREKGGLMCVLVDITSEKCAALAERQAAEDATRRKEQQERFVDMISHEIRNPLSAILHCVEDIEDAADKTNKSDIDVASVKEAIATINLCVVHQRNIVNDVLNYSKLDSNLLSLTPSPTQPRNQLAQSLRMFRQEFRKNEVDLHFKVDQSYVDLDISWVMADMARIQQVVVNLVSNSIKFSSKAGDRENIMTVSCSASEERPSSYPTSVVFFDTDEAAAALDCTHSKEWGQGDKVYIMVAVRDTGIGIREEDQQRLFERFHQATPKTGKDYGGSGLGLNISRKICHLHGGEIGVSSTFGQGSTFGFFFKVKKSDPPEHTEEFSQHDHETAEITRKTLQILSRETPKQSELGSTARSPRSPPATHVVDSSEAERSEADLNPMQTEEAVVSPAEQETFDRSGHERPKQSIIYSSHDRTQLLSDNLTPAASQPDKSTVLERRGMRDKREGSHGSVLLVEDNIINQRILVKKLEARGFAVAVASNGEEAVALIKNALESSSRLSSAFGIILMDQEMPIMDGNAATKAIRQMEAEVGDGRIPILGVTANVRGEQQSEMRDSGMDDVISKPYRMDDLVRKIAETDLDSYAIRADDDREMLRREAQRSGSTSVLVSSILVATLVSLCGMIGLSMA